MLARTFSIVKKTQERGFKWFYDRFILECRIPETILGKKLQPIAITLYRLYDAVTKPLKFLIQAKSLTPDTLYLFYDLEIAPITYNFCETLSMANLERKKQGLTYLHVVFVPGPEGGLRKEMEDYERVIDQSARRARMHNLLFPATHLIPHCIGFSNCASRKEAELIRKKASPHIYPNQYSTVFPSHVSFFEGPRTKSLDMMPIQAPKKALEYIDQWLEDRCKNRKTIVITLRQYDYMPKRNSNITAWSHFAKSLNPEEYFVVIVPDTEKAMQQPNPELVTFEHFTEACWNVELRSALYERAYLNLGVNNGPLSLCWLNKNCRYIMFKIITPDVPQTTIETQIKHGFTPGQSPAFALEHQKWVWEDDEVGVIEREFYGMCRAIEKIKY